MNSLFMKKQNGFTLVEIMMVIAIIAILAMIAIPRYTSYVKRSRSAQGVIHVKKMYDALTEWYTSPNMGNGTFPDSPAEVGYQGLTFRKNYPSVSEWWENGDGMYYFSYATTNYGTGKAILVEAEAIDGPDSQRLYAGKIQTTKTGVVEITYVSKNF